VGNFGRVYENSPEMIAGEVSRAPEVRTGAGRAPGVVSTMVGWVGSAAG